MIHFPEIRARRFTIRMRELTIGQSLELAARPAHLEQANTTAFLSHVVRDPALDPARWRVGERTLAVAHYLACVLDDPDFAIGVARYSDYLVPESEPVPDSVDLGEVLGEVWRMRHLDGRTAEAIERLEIHSLTGRGLWVAGMMAGQLYRDGEDAPESMTDGALDEWLAARVTALTALPESEFEALLLAFHAGRERLTHLFRIDAGDTGIICPPSTEDAGFAPARFPVRSALGSWAFAMAKSPD